MRYQVYSRSQSGHCCFEATVVDTTKPQIVDGRHVEDGGRTTPLRERM